MKTKERAIREALQRLDEVEEAVSIARAAVADLLAVLAAPRGKPDPAWSVAEQVREVLMSEPSREWTKEEIVGRLRLDGRGPHALEQALHRGVKAGEYDHRARGLYQYRVRSKAARAG